MKNHSMLPLFLLLITVSSASLWSAESDGQALGAEVVTTTSSVAGTTLATDERQALQAVAVVDTGDPLAQQRAGEFYKEPLFWGGVGAALLLVILL